MCPSRITISLRLINREAITWCEPKPHQCKFAAKIGLAVLLIDEEKVAPESIAERGRHTPAEATKPRFFSIELLGIRAIECANRRRILKRRNLINFARLARSGEKTYIHETFRQNQRALRALRQIGGSVKRSVKTTDLLGPLLPPPAALA